MNDIVFTFEDAREAIHTISRAISESVHENMTHISAKEVGLDSRCGYIWVGCKAVAIEKSRAPSLDYYGGFEYIDPEFRQEMGDWVFYFADDDDTIFDEETGKELNDSRVGSILAMVESDDMA